MPPPSNCSALPYSSSTRLNCIMCMAAAVCAVLAGILLLVQYFGFFYSSALRSVFNDVFVVVVVVQVLQAVQLFIFALMTVLRGERVVDAGGCSPSGMTYAMCNVNASIHQCLDAMGQVLQTVFFVVLANSRRLSSLEQVGNSDDGRIFRTSEGGSQGAAHFLWEHGLSSSGVSSTSGITQPSHGRSDDRRKRRCMCSRQSEAAGRGFPFFFCSCYRRFFSCCGGPPPSTNRTTRNSRSSGGSDGSPAHDTVAAAAAATATAAAAAATSASDSVAAGTSVSVSVLQWPLVSNSDDVDVTTAEHPMRHALLRLTWKFYLVAFLYASVSLLLCWILLLYVPDIVVVPRHNGAHLETPRTLDNTLFFSQKFAWCWIPATADLSPQAGLWQKSVLVLLQVAAAYAWPVIFFLVRCMRTPRCGVLPLP
ncbi:uncharacterized protein Tco025E_05099 [Trypanosoma conorhini]|uniref:Transmembrane protein n=1 Tax=Trypanosoma conorhini TaxID=83891 RepID=A0A3S5IT47_9TRYP|nr:uncharacterized protein Tco025E_05099 [Trypanosoma conorhini]RNF16720.1 hypothetical protein Tco025E_05099 [Trypanosoma conorhini]